MDTTTAKYWPVIYSGKNVREILNGQKTTIRRDMDSLNGKTFPYKVGDILWVMEKCDLKMEPGEPNKWVYKADHPSEYWTKYYKAEKMPKQAARIFLEVTAITPNYFAGCWIVDFKKVEKPVEFN